MGLPMPRQADDWVALTNDIIRENFGKKDCPMRLRKALDIITKEKERYGGIEAVKTITSEFRRRRFNRNPLTVIDLENHLFSTKHNSPTQDHCNLGAHLRTTTLKVKIYMGDGWNVDFRDLDLGLGPDLYVKVGIVDAGQMKRTKTMKNQWVPTWGEEFSFTLVDPEAARLSIQVYDQDTLSSDDFAGKATLSVYQLNPGIRSVPLVYKDGKKCSSTWLLIRFVFV